MSAFFSPAGYENRQMDPDPVLRVCRVHFFQKGVLKMVGAAYSLQKLVHFLSLHEPSPTKFQIFKTWQAQEGIFDIEIINNCTP